MPYLRDKKITVLRRQKKINLAVVFALVILFIFFFRQPVFNFLSATARTAVRPFWSASDYIGNSLSSTAYFFQTKKSLLQENQSLQDELDGNIAVIADREALLDENMQLKGILNRTENNNMTLGAILSKPNKSLYDTLIIDIGLDKNLAQGNKVFAYGDIIIGEIAEVYAKTSLVKLYSTPGNTTDSILGQSNTYVQATGRGGGNFEITVPKDLNVANGTEVTIPGINNYVLGAVANVISDPRDPFVKLLISSPVNVADLKFVEIEP